MNSPARLSEANASPRTTCEPSHVGRENDNDSYRHTDLGLIAALCLVLFLAGNGHISLWDRDEAWYAQTAREMIERDDYVVPTFNGEPRLRKPILIYWLMAAAYAIFGDNEFGARFCSGLAGTFTCLLTYRLGVRMGGRMVGLGASLMLAVAPFMVIESKLATTDAVLTAIHVAAMSCLWEIFESARQSPQLMIGGTRSTLKTRVATLRDPVTVWALAFWALMGLSILTKGPFGPAVVVATALPWLILSRRWTVLRKLSWGTGTLIVLTICLPWGIAIYKATAGEFYRVAIGEQALGHSLSAMNNHRGFPGYYLLLTLAGLMPWTLLLSLAFVGLRGWARQGGPRSFLLAWVLGPMVLLELMRTKLPQYYLPAFPAWSILIAWGLADGFAAGRRFLDSAAGIRRTWAIGGTGVVMAVLLCVAALTQFPAELLVPSLVVSMILGAGTIGAVVAIYRQRDQLSWGMMVGTWWSVQLVIAAWLLPSAECCRIIRRSVDELRAQSTQESTIVLFRFREPSLVYYLGRPTPSFSSTKELATFLRESGPAVTLLRESDLAKLSHTADITLLAQKRIQAKTINAIRPPPVSLARLAASTAPVLPAGAANREVEIRR